jgi:hypothetical protein
MSDDPVAILHNLKQKRSRERANITRFSTMIDGFNDSTSLDDLEHCRGRLRETLNKVLSLDDAIHDILSDKEYAEDTKVCEDYIDKAKRAILKASRWTDGALSASTARLGLTQPTNPPPQPRTP